MKIILKVTQRMMTLDTVGAQEYWVIMDIVSIFNLNIQ